MFKLILNRMRRGVAAREVQSGLSWLCDPLAHPVLDRMNTTELGDMPLGAVRYECERCR